MSGNRFCVALSVLYRPMFEYHTNHRLTAEDKNIMPPEVVDNHERIVAALEKDNLEELVLALKGEWTEAMYFNDRPSETTEKDAS